MSRLIDADTLVAKYGNWYTEEGSEEGFIGTIKSLVDTIPTIEPERKTGKWEDDPSGYKCSECGGYLEIDCGDMDMNYCPNCGARMGGDR